MSSVSDGGIKGSPVGDDEEGVEDAANSDVKGSPVGDEEEGVEDAAWT